MLVVTRSTVVIHVSCNAMRSAVGFWLIVPFPSLVALLPWVVALCVAVVIGQLLVHHRRHQGFDLGGLGIGGGRESTRKFRDV